MAKKAKKEIGANVPQPFDTYRQMESSPLNLDYWELSRIFRLAEEEAKSGLEKFGQAIQIQQVACILAEEVGEVCKAANDHVLRKEGALDEFKKELIQVIALSIRAYVQAGQMQHEERIANAPPAPEYNCRPMLGFCGNFELLDIT